MLYEIPKVVIGENRTFMGEEQRLREKGIEVEVLDDQTCVNMMSDFIRLNPTLWNEDIGEDN